MPKIPLLAGAATVAIVLASCSSNSHPAASTTSAAASATTGAQAGPPVPSSTTTTAAATGGAIAPIPAADISPAGTWGQQPTVTVPSGQPPTVLESADLITGSGQAVVAHDTVTVQYAGYSWVNKAEFDSSWSRGQPTSFSLDQVIKGWSEGIVGMKVGGRRELIIPPGLGYGANPPTPKIAPNDTLIFIVDLLKIGS